MRLVPLCRYGPDTLSAPRSGQGMPASAQESPCPAADELPPSPGGASLAYHAAGGSKDQQAPATKEASNAKNEFPVPEDCRLDLVYAHPGNDFLYVILSVRLSHCGQFVACGCSDGFVRIYRTPTIPRVLDKPEASSAKATAIEKSCCTPLCRILLCQKGNTSPVTCIAWRPTAPVRSTKAHNRRTHGTDGHSHVFIATTGAGEIFQCALTCIQPSAGFSPVEESSISYSINLLWKGTIPHEQLLCCSYAPPADLFAAAGSTRTIHIFNEHSKKLFRKLDKPPVLPCVKPVETAATAAKTSNIMIAFGGKGIKSRWVPTSHQKNEDETGDLLRLKQKPAAHYYAAAAAASRGAHANRITQLIFLKKFKIAPEDVASSSNIKADKSAASKTAATLPAATGKDEAFKDWNNKTLLLSVGADESVKLWDVDEGSCISTLADVAPLGDAVSIVSPNSIVVASCRNQQQVQLFTLPSFTAATTVDFNCTCSCTFSLQSSMNSSAAAVSKTASIQSPAAAGLSSSVATNAKNDATAASGPRCCGNGCKYYQDSSTPKTTVTDSKCEEADLCCYIHACAALSVDGGDLLICGGSNRNQLRCYVRPTGLPSTLPGGSSSALASGPSSVSPPAFPGSKQAIKGVHTVNFSLFGLISFEAPPNTVDCRCLSLTEERFAEDGLPLFTARQQQATAGGVLSSGVTDKRRGDGSPSNAVDALLRPSAEAVHAAGNAYPREDTELLHKSSDCNSESGFGAPGKVKKISFTAVFARPQGGGVTEKKKAALLKNSKQTHKTEQEKNCLQNSASRGGCIALIVTACHDQVHFFGVAPGPAALPAGFVEAVREQAQQQLEDRAQNALFRVLMNHADEAERKVPPPYASTGNTKVEVIAGESALDEGEAAGVGPFGARNGNYALSALSYM